MIPKRIIIYPKDVQRITGRSERYGRNLLKRIKNELGKEEHQLISVFDFADFTGLEIEHVQAFLID
ncbi:MAG: hypothetical protein AAFY41_07630 [Bacteroidota bacterium]